MSLALGRVNDQSNYHVQPATVGMQSVQLLTDASTVARTSVYKNYARCCRQSSSPKGNRLRCLSEHPTQKMDTALGFDLNSLLTKLAATQQARCSAKLSERNVVELINKLRQLGILSEGELIHTLNGKEYLTIEHFRGEIQNALRQAGGRLSLVELPTIVGVDLVHCERQASVIVAESGGTILEVQGDLISTEYFDSIAAEIDDQLQDAGQIGIGELAAQYGLATEMVLNVVSARLGSAIHGERPAENDHHNSPG